MKLQKCAFITELGVVTNNNNVITKFNINPLADQKCFWSFF
jgi:hypothetical protein